MGQVNDILITEAKRIKKPKTGDVNAITWHLPQADQCPASLQAMATSAKTIFPQFLLLSMM